MRGKIYASLFILGALVMCGCASNTITTPKDVVNQSCVSDPSSSLATFVGKVIENAAGAGYTVVVKETIQGDKAQSVGKTLGSGDLVFDTLVILQATDGTGRIADNYLIIISDKGCVVGKAPMSTGQVDDAVNGVAK